MDVENALRIINDIAKEKMNKGILKSEHGHGFPVDTGDLYDVILSLSPQTGAVISQQIRSVNVLREKIENALISANVTRKYEGALIAYDQLTTGLSAIIDGEDNG